jgi:hypothetical protein
MTTSQTTHRNSGKTTWLALVLACVSPFITLQTKAWVGAKEEGIRQQKIEQLETGVAELKADHKDMKEKMYTRLGRIEESLARLEQLHQGKLAGK